MQYIKNTPYIQKFMCKGKQLDTLKLTDYAVTCDNGHSKITFYPDTQKYTFMP